jgi:hypothetical protein
MKTILLSLLFATVAAAQAAAPTIVTYVIGQQNAIYGTTKVQIQTTVLIYSQTPATGQKRYRVTLTGTFSPDTTKPSTKDFSITSGPNPGKFELAATVSLSIGDTVTAVTAVETVDGPVVPVTVSM